MNMMHIQTSLYKPSCGSLYSALSCIYNQSSSTSEAFFADQIPSSLTSKLGLKSTSVYVSGDNLLTFTKYPGRDPEVGESGQDTYSYPNIRKIVFGLNVKF